VAQIYRFRHAAFAVAARDLPHGLICELDHLRYLKCGESLLQSQQGQRAERNSNLLGSAAEQLAASGWHGVTYPSMPKLHVKPTLLSNLFPRSQH